MDQFRRNPELIYYFPVELNSIIMKTRKETIKRNKRIFFLAIALIIVFLFAINFQDVLEGLKDGARDAGLSF